MMNKNKIKVIIADDHDVYRDGLRLLLEADENIEVVAEAANGKKLIELVKEYKPDVVLTDLIMPEIDGIMAIREMKEAGFGKCIALSTFQTDSLIVEALAAGAVGYILKNAQKGEIIEALKSVNQSMPYYCKSTSPKLARLLRVSKFNPGSTAGPQLFSGDEKEIIRYICQEQTSEEIGKIMFIGKRNVERIRTRILKKMNVKTVAGIVNYAIKNGIYDVNANK